MRSEPLTARGLAAVAAALVLASCGNHDSSSSSADGSSGSASPPQVVETSPQTAGSSPSESPQGSPEHPVTVEPTRSLLDWKSVAGSTEDMVTVGGRWALTVESGAAEAVLRGPKPTTIKAAAGSSITDAFLTDTHALVVEEDRQATRPDRAVLIDLVSGRTTTLDDRSDPPTVVGGTWALGPDALVHATSGGHGRYCLATVDLASGSGSTGWCARPRHGFSRATITGSATTMMVFDDHHPSCRSLVEVSGEQLVPIPGVTQCKGWDSSLDAPGAVWSVVPNDRRIEVAHFYAHNASGWFDLGPGTSGSLVTCGGDTFFTRDPQSRSDPATLMRWSDDDDALSVAYESPGTGHAFLSPPRCGGTHLTVTAYSQAGDEQVTTNLG